PLIGDARLADGPGLLLVIEKIPETNVLEVTEGVEKALDDMRPGLAGIEIDTTVFRPATYVEQSIDNLSTALLIGAVLVVLGMVAFFFEWRRLLISLVSIALSLVVAALVLYERGTPFNMMILAGLVVALGVLIDDAIIDTENITRRLRQHRQAGSDKSTARIVLEASLETRNPLIFGTLIVLLTVLPVLFLTEATGRFMEPFVLSYVVAVLTSLAVALMVTPALSLILFPDGSPGRRESPIIPALQRAYNAALTRIARYPYAALVVVVVALIVGLIGALTLDGSLVPSFKQTDLLIAVEAAPGTSRSEMNRLMTLVGDELQTIDGVRNVGSHVGRAITGDQVVSINSGEFWVSIDSSADYDKTVTAIREVMDNYPGLSREVQTYQPERVGEALRGAEHDIVVRLYGSEFEVLQTQAETVRQSIEGIDGIKTALVDPIVNEPQVEIEVDLDAVKDYGLKPGDVRRAATTLLSGLRVGSLYQEQKVFDVVVWGDPSIRNSLNDIRNLMIDTPRGELVALGDVAEVSIVPSPSVVKRDGVSRFIDINVDVSGRNLGAVANDIDRRLDTVQLPFEYHAEVLGDYADRQAARQGARGAMVVAALGIFLLFQASFASWRLALIAIVALLTALVGGVLVVIIFSSGTLSIGALLGFFAILAITARNVIALIHRYQDLRQDGEPVESALVLSGARERLAPVVMTMAILALLLLPVVIPGQIAGYEVIQPMAIVILG
ncbi:MAG: efflux RND transporter permease subunit, partial [Chloroflexi bacterium]